MNNTIFTDILYSTDSTDIVTPVYKMNQCFGQPRVKDNLNLDESDKAILKGQMKLIEEELVELRDAYDLGDTTAMRDAIADILVVTIGIEVTPKQTHISGNAVWFVVSSKDQHDVNGKFYPCNKFLKGVNFKDPQFA